MKENISEKRRFELDRLVVMIINEATAAADEKKKTRKRKERADKSDRSQRNVNE